MLHVHEYQHNVSLITDEICTWIELVFLYLGGSGEDKKEEEDEEEEEEEEDDLEEPEEIELFAPDEPEHEEDTRTFVSTGLVSFCVDFRFILRLGIDVSTL